MAELLIKAISFTHPDTTKDRQGAHKKGDIVFIAPDGHTWGASESLPKFVVVKCPDVPKETIRYYVNSWTDDFSYEVLNANPTTATYNVRVTNDSDNVSHDNPMTLAKVDNYLTSWGCTAVSFANRAVDFTISLWDMVRSDGFWSVDDIYLYVTFTLVDYTPATGVGIIDAEMPTAWANRHDVIIRKIQERGGVIVSSIFPLYRFSITRTSMFDVFKSDVKRRCESVYRRHQYYIAESTVDYIIGQGGSITVSGAQLSTYVNNRLDN